MAKKQQKDIVIIANFCGDMTPTNNNRFIYLCKELSQKHNVELITSDFSHFMKRHRDTLHNPLPFKITFLHEPGYQKNISIKRFLSHRHWGKEVANYLAKRKTPDVVYCAVPSLAAPLAAAKYCQKHQVRFIIDIQDLWPEAFNMFVKLPILTNAIFSPFSYQANAIYKQADAICAVSRSYVERALRVNKKCSQGHTVFLGTNLSVFDYYASSVAPLISKTTSHELWLGYCGSLAASYDIPSVIYALKLLKEGGNIPPKFIVLGDGARRREFEALAKERKIDAIFLGKLPYNQMCAQLVQCDIVVNPITKGSVASIINKHGDYAAAGVAVLNTQESAEYRTLVETYQMGLNCKNADPADLAAKLKKLITDPSLRNKMGKNARRCAEEKFDRKTTYKALIQCILETKEQKI